MDLNERAKLLSWLNHTLSLHRQGSDPFLAQICAKSAVLPTPLCFWPQPISFKYGNQEFIPLQYILSPGTL